MRLNHPKEKKKGERKKLKQNTQKTHTPNKTPLSLVATVCENLAIFFHFEQIVHFCSEHTENIFFVVLLTCSLEFNWKVDDEARRDSL